MKTIYNLFKSNKVMRDTSTASTAIAGMPLLFADLENNAVAYLVMQAGGGFVKGCAQAFGFHATKKELERYENLHKSKPSMFALLGRDIPIFDPDGYKVAAQETERILRSPSITTPKEAVELKKDDDFLEWVERHLKIGDKDTLPLLRRDDSQVFGSSINKSELRLMPDKPFLLSRRTYPDARGTKYLMEALRKNGLKTKP